MTAPIIVTIPGLRLVSEQNQREHWATKARRVKTQRFVVGAHLRTRGVGHHLALPLTVTITRIAPRRLDSDNATASAKACRDAVAAWLGRDDGDPRIAWRVEQRHGAPKEYAVEIIIEAADAALETGT